MAQAASWPDLRGKERKKKPWLNGLPRVIFVGDMGDFCSKSVPDDYIKEEIIEQIRSHPLGRRHFYLLLTKQIQRLARISEEVGGLPDNCMAMTSVTSQPFADSRIPWLLKVRCKWRGISAEPLLGPVDLEPWLSEEESAQAQGRDRSASPAPHGQHGMADVSERCTNHASKGSTDGAAYRSVGQPRLNWVIAGGASGDEAPPMYPSLPRILRNQCKGADVPFFFKQHGEWIHQVDLPSADGPIDFILNAKIHDWADQSRSFRVGKKAAGAVLDGQEWREMPEVKS